MSGSNAAGTRIIEDVLFWELFEPDKIQRTASKSSLSQKNRVAIGLYHYSFRSSQVYAYTYTASSVEGCSASASVDGKKGAAASKVQCGTLGSLLDALGVPPGVVRTFIPLVMDTAPNKKLKLGAKASL